MAARSMTIILHSGDFDKAMAAFILANGAASKGLDVTMFFTFWGLKIIEKGGAAKASLSRMNFGGLGKAMIGRKMRENNVAPLETLMADAAELGVRLIACEMTMNLMGVPRDRLIEETTGIGGVGTYMDAAIEGHVNLFI